MILAAALLASTWLRLSAPHFELYTDTGERNGREILARFDQVRLVFPERSASPLPVRIFVFSSERQFADYSASQTVTGFFRGGPDRDTIAMLYRGPESRRVIFHEYVHLLLSHAAPRLPKWFEEGTAEFYSNVEVHGGHARIGAPIASHLALLSARAWPPVGEFTAREPEGGFYYALCWALVHMLNLAPEYRPGMPRFLEALAGGRSAADAFLEAFGRPLEAAWQDLRRHVARRPWPVAEVAVDQAPARLDPDLRPAGRAELEIALAELALRVGRHDLAEQAFTRLAREWPESAEAHTALASLALARRDHPEARWRLERAVELGAREGETWFQYAMLLRDTGAPATQVTAALRQAIGANPNHAEAHFLLGRDGSGKEALAHMRRAASILPRQVHFWHALALASHRLGQIEEARRAAWRALNAALTDREIEMARAAIQLAESPSAAPLPKRPEVSTPPGWRNLEGDRRVEGVLEHIECLGGAARLHIRAANRTTAVRIADPRRVVLRNLGSASFEFACGPQPERPVLVEYLAASGEITALEFR